MNLSEFVSSLISTIVGGAVLAFMFFFAKEKCFPLPKLTGRWYFEQNTDDTAYKPFEEMVLRYVAILVQDRGKIEGTAEKIYERSSTGEREYVGKNRTRAKIGGYIEKKYLGRDRIYLHVVEEGHGRESTTFYELTMSGSKSMRGDFSSMVAQSSGKVRWQRHPF